MTTGPSNTATRPIASDEEELKKIAARGGEEGLDYATDEDTRSYDSDPFSNRFDLGKNPIAFARRQMAMTEKLLQKVFERSVEDGDGYQRARQAFGLLLSEYWRTGVFRRPIPRRRARPSRPQGRRRRPRPV